MVTSKNKIKTSPTTLSMKQQHDAEKSLDLILGESLSSVTLYKKIKSYSTWKNWYHKILIKQNVNIVTINRAWNRSASFRLTQWLKILPHMIRSYYRCCCINEPVIFSHCVHLKLRHRCHALYRDDIVSLNVLSYWWKICHQSKYFCATNCRFLQASDASLHGLHEKSWLSQALVHAAGSRKGRSKGHWKLCQRSLNAASKVMHSAGTVNRPTLH